jgi:hypothetical protein
MTDLPISTELFLYPMAGPIYYNEKSLKGFESSTQERNPDSLGRELAIPKTVVFGLKDKRNVEAHYISRQ